MSQAQKFSKPSMRHLYLYTHLLLQEANKQGRRVRLEWAQIATASIGPDPTSKADLVLRLPHMASVGTEEDARLLRALIPHEILCHGHHTDFTVVPDPCIGGVLENVLEDPRGELRSLKPFPGSAKVIREGIEILVDREVFKGLSPECDEHPASIPDVEPIHANGEGQHEHPPGGGLGNSSLGLPPGGAQGPRRDDRRRSW
jgi:hypothetical protein